MFFGGQRQQVAAKALGGGAQLEVADLANESAELIGLGPQQRGDQRRLLLDQAEQAMRVDRQHTAGGDGAHTEQAGQAGQECCETECFAGADALHHRGRAVGGGAEAGKLSFQDEQQFVGGFPLAADFSILGRVDDTADRRQTLQHRIGEVVQQRGCSQRLKNNRIVGLVRRDRIGQTGGVGHCILTVLV